MVEGGRLEIYCRLALTVGSNPTLSAILLGEVTEWSKVHDWKSCVQQCTEGSNPSLSAIYTHHPRLARAEVMVGSHDWAP